MANFNLSIDLMKFWGSQIITTKSGVDVVVIPIEENKLKRTAKGAVMAYLQATEKKQLGPYADTHFIKPRFSKEAFASLTDEQRNAIPFVGSVYMQTNNYNNNGGGYNNPNTYTPTNTSATDIDDSIF